MEGTKMNSAQIETPCTKEIFRRQFPETVPDVEVPTWVSIFNKLNGPEQAIISKALRFIQETNHNAGFG